VAGPGSLVAGPLDRAGIPAVVAGCLALAVLIGAGDYWSGLEIDFTVFYAIPIAVATWRLGFRGGTGFAVLCEIGEYWIERSAGLRYADPWAQFWNPVLHLAYFLVIVAVVHRLKVAYQREQVLSREDLLTGLPNSRAFLEAAEGELRRIRRTDDPISLLYLDCDDFKAVNDRYGHSAGDALLCYVGGVLKVQVRATDTPARIGGDEFAVILPGANAEAVLEVAQRLKAALEAPATQGENDVKVSMGAVTFLSPPLSVDVMLHAGDTLMYQAKAAGKASIRTAVIRG
jgi:diguanylate cyclase (GGDEF)-like protein